MSPRSFPHRPFAILKKLVDRGTVRLAPDTDKLLAAPRHVDRSLSEEEAFHRAMAEVRPLGWSQVPLRLPPPVELKGAADDEKEALDQLKAFVEGQGRLDPFVTGEGVEGAATRRGRHYLKRLKNGEFSVQAHLDLHGMDPSEAAEVLERFIRQSIWQGHTCVRIVHGRGKHSSSEPAVLKAQVTKWLSSRKTSRFVVAFASARWTDGGGGAVYVLLYRT